MAAFERFENALDQAWTSTGTWAYVNSGSHTGSAYHSTLVALDGNGKYIDPAGGGAIAYAAGWFNVVTDSMEDGSNVLIGGLFSTGNVSLASLDLVKTGAQLGVRCNYRDSTNKVTAIQDISASTWYHWGLFADNTNDLFAWYLSTTIDLGAAKNSGAAVMNADPARLKLMFNSPSGTWGSNSTKIGYDSIDWSTSSLVHTAEDSSGVVPVIAAQYRLRRS